MSERSAQPDVVVVGAGILGLFCALHLAQHRLRVLVLDAGSAGGGASGHSGALVRSTCATDAEAILAQRSMTVYRDWPARIGGDPVFCQVGALELAGADRAPALRSRIGELQAIGIAVEALAPDALPELFPAISTDGVALASYQAEAGCVEPIAAMRSLFAQACAAGAHYQGKSPVRALAIDRKRCLGVITDSGTISAGAVIVASGRGADALLAQPEFGLMPCLSTLAIFHPGADQPPSSLPTVLDHVQDAWFRPTLDGGMLVGMGLGRRREHELEANSADAWPGGYAGLRAAYIQAASRRFGLSAAGACRGMWESHYVYSADSLPIVGRHPGVAGLYLAVGDSGGAFKLAPALGEDLVMQMLDPESGPHGTISAFAPSRFPIGE